MKNELNTEAEKTSYALGLDIGTSFSRLPIELDMDALFQGIEDIIKGQERKITQEEFQGLMTAFQKKMQAHGQKMQEEAAGNNKKAGEDFLANNKDKDGIVTLDSGLQYEVISEGDGSKPVATDTVSVHYTGTLLDGTVFDSSVQRGEPAKFPVNQVIAGWTEALQLMNVGSKYKLYIPSDLAYGARGAGQAIGPHATLVFEVELLGIEG